MAGKSPIKVEMRTSSINESWSVYQRVDRAEQGDSEIPKSGDTQWPAKLGASILVHQTSCSYGRLPIKKNMVISFNAIIHSTNGLIHSINGVFLVLITGISGHNCELRSPSKWHVMMVGWIRCS